MRRVVVTGIMLLLSTPLFAAPIVKRLIINVQNGSYWSGRCPHRFDFAADITSRYPGEVTVQWIRSDGAMGPSEVRRFTRGNETIRVYDRWEIGRGFRGWEQVRVTDRRGNVATSRRMSFQNRCR